MALTDDQRASTRRYLGYPDASAGAYSFLESRMTAITAAGEAQVIALLTSLATLETTLAGAWSVQKVKRAEEVELTGMAGLIALRGEGNRLVYQLAGILGVEVARSAFSPMVTSGFADLG